MFQADRNPGRYLTTNYRGQAKNKWNRMVKHGLEPKIEVLTSPEEISPVLPRVMEIAGIRQAELTGRRKLDRSHHAVFFTDVVLSHASRDEVELMLLRVGGEIGAYSLTFLDGTIARMWSSHYHPRWSEYSPGHILSRALVERCVHRPEIDALDWMKGLEPYKLRTANHVEPAQSLQAWSGLGGRSVGEMSRWIRTTLSKTRERYPALRRLQIALRQRIGRRSATETVSTELPA
jgi:CelD/BcsL family acetyltransferase involved in cellulose biosynthesis